MSLLHPPSWTLSGVWQPERATLLPVDTLSGLRLRSCTLGFPYIAPNADARFSIPMDDPALSEEVKRGGPDPQLTDREVGDTCRVLSLWTVTPCGSARSVTKRNRLKWMLFQSDLDASGNRKRIEHLPAWANHLSIVPAHSCFFFEKGPIMG